MLLPLQHHHQQQEALLQFFCIEYVHCEEKEDRKSEYVLSSLSISFVETVGPAEGASSVVVQTCCSCSAQTSSSSVRHSSVVSVRVMDLQRSSSPPGTTTDSQICGIRNKLAILICINKTEKFVCLSWEIKVRGAKKFEFEFERLEINRIGKSRKEKLEFEFR